MEKYLYPKIYDWVIQKVPIAVNVKIVKNQYHVIFNTGYIDPDTWYNAEYRCNGHNETAIVMSATKPGKGNIVVQCPIEIKYNETMLDTVSVIPKDGNVTMYEMQRFVNGKTNILVATTVIEVGVNVPNASVMVIESAERFGLSQLHQLRGRVGRGANQSYCILMSGNKISADGKTRLQTMIDTNDGFKLAEVDLKLRGPGDMMGTKQSGLLELRFTNLAEDYESIKKTRKTAINLIKEDPELSSKENIEIKNYLKNNIKSNINWSRIS